MIRITPTLDGSNTLYVPSIDEHYHSTNGAIQESRHVFIENGYMQCSSNPVRIFEMGFGTGLNALLTLELSVIENRIVEYHSVEKYPLEKRIWEKVDYGSMLGSQFEKYYSLMHNCNWDIKCKISNNFSLLKMKKDIRHMQCGETYDIIYFDAFAPGKQAELWTFDVLSFIASITKKHGIFITYSARGQLKRDLAKLGFEVFHPDGPPGKRQITRAVKMI